VSSAEAEDGFSVCLRELRFQWPGQERPVIDSPFFSVRPGERVFIKGPSGSGKSTLLSLIAGILRPDSGSVWVNGTCLSALGGSARDRFRGERIGFIFQQFNLIPYLSILENVLIPCRFSAKRRSRAEEQAGSALLAAKNLLEQLDLPPSLWNRQVTRLSVGQQQRVAAARALIGGPAMVMADEPTSSLDADHRKVFLRLLLEECRSAGSTLLFVSHDHSLADEFSISVKLAELNRASSPESAREAA
jgi:putative ABC transport system ATP-binding protein